MAPSSSPVASRSSGGKYHGATTPDADAVNGFGVALGDASREMRTAERDARSPMRDERRREPREESASSRSESASASSATHASSSLLGVPQVAGSMGSARPSATGAVALGAGGASDRSLGRGVDVAPGPFLDGEGRVGAALVGRDDVWISVRAYDSYAGLASAAIGEGDASRGMGAFTGSAASPAVSGAEGLTLAPEGVAATGGGLVAAALQGLELAAQGRGHGVRTEGVVAAPSADDDGSDVGLLADEVVAAPVDARASGSDVATSDESGASASEREAEVTLLEGSPGDIVVTSAPGRGLASPAAEASAGVVVADPSARQERVDRALDAVTLPSRLELAVSDRDGVWSLEIGRHHAGLEVLLRGDREFVGAVRGVEQDLRESLRATGEVARVAVSVDTSAGRGGDPARDQGRDDAWGHSESSSAQRQGRATPSREASSPPAADAVRGGVTVSRLA